MLGAVQGKAFGSRPTNAWHQIRLGSGRRCLPGRQTWGAFTRRCLAGAIVNLVGDVLERLGRERAQVGALGEIVAQQPVEARAKRNLVRVEGAVAATMECLEPQRRQVCWLVRPQTGATRSASLSARTVPAVLAIGGS